MNNPIVSLLEQTIKFRKEYMTQLPEKFIWSSMEELVLKFGTEYKYETLPAKFKYGIPQQCFYNSANLVKKHKNLVYVEGYGLLSGFPAPIHHAWVVEQGSTQVIDITASFVSYFGIEFPTPYVKKQWKKHPHGVSILDDWKDEFLLLRMSEEEIKKLLEI